MVRSILKIVASGLGALEKGLEIAKGWVERKATKDLREQNKAEGTIAAHREIQAKEMKDAKEARKAANHSDVESAIDALPSSVRDDK